MEDQWWFIAVLEEQLVEYVEDDRENYECSEANSNLLGQRKLLILLCERVARKFLEETHDWVL